MQLKKELEDLKAALKRKEDTIQEQQTRIAALADANKTLAEGLDQLRNLHSDLSGSDSEEESLPRRPSAQGQTRNATVNGHSNGSRYRHTREPTTPNTSEFLKVVNRLDKGHFDFS